MASRVNRLAAGLVVGAALWAGTVSAEARQGSESVTPEEVAAAIDRLGNLDYGIRAKAAQTVRRAPAALAVTALLRAVDEHADGYVRFRALVLLSGFNDPRARDVMRRAIDDPNDRLREVGYAWFEAHPETSLASDLLKRLETEMAEFVRPALIRALAALGSDPAVQKALLRDVFRGQDFFRSVVIEALGDHQAKYAVPALIDVAKLDGPLRDDAVLALGRIGDPRAIETFAELQRHASQADQPTIAAAICLAGRNCESHRGFLIQTVKFAVSQIGFQELVRSAAGGLAALAERSDRQAFQALVDVGIPSQDPARAPIALALGRVAVRNPAFVLDSLAHVADLEGTVLLLRDAFDMFEEDFDEERFYVTVRRAFWEAPEKSALRTLANELIARLDF
jgi:HEAT repeat protein